MKSYINTNSSVTTLSANHLVRYLYRKSRLKVCTLANYRSYSTTKSDSQSSDLPPVPATLLSGGLLRTFGDEVRGGSELKNSGKYIDKGTQTNVNKLDTESKNEFDTGVPETPDTIVGVIDSYSKSH